MKISIFVKTFLILFLSFTLVFLLNMYISYTTFAPMYLEENITVVKEAIMESIDDIENGSDIKDTELYNVTRSETSLIRLKNGSITETLGPEILTNEDILEFIIHIYDSEETINEGKLKYNSYLEDDIHRINYIYEFEFGDYIIISTKIQSLDNVDRVLNNINQTQLIFFLIAIPLLSTIISLLFSRPIKRINRYAKKISNLEFDENLNLKRRDEFKELVSSLNEMTFNLKKSYSELNQMNKKLHHDIEFEKKQEEKKKNLIMTINHEIKTPLAVMKGMVEGMIDGVGKYKDIDHYLKELIPQIDEIEAITKDLTYSLMLEDKATSKDSTNTKTLHDSLSNVVEYGKQNNISVSLKLEPSDVKINEELLGIMVSNILKNAILYTSFSTVYVKGFIEGDSYHVEVKNKGYINDIDLEKVFESFYRSDTVKRSTNGSGLGLHIVKQICNIYDYPYKIYNDNGFVIAKVQLKI